jgi:putative hydrolase of the HAD superfamily
MRYTTLLFDLDCTLYSSDCGLWDAIRDRMSLYMLERLRLPEDQVSSLRRHYYQTYGTTLRGLQIHHAVDPEDYLVFVHDLPLPDFLQPQPELRSLLLSLPQKRWIFTNADDAHARRVVAALGLDGCFDGVIDVRAVQFACKPEEIAYRRALDLVGRPDPGRCVMLDDSPANLLPAHRLGIRTVWVGGNLHSHPGTDLSVPELLALPVVMPELWEVDRGY